MIHTRFDIQYQNGWNIGSQHWNMRPHLELNQKRQENVVILKSISWTNSMFIKKSYNLDELGLENSCKRTIFPENIPIHITE